MCVEQNCDTVNSCCGGGVGGLFYMEVVIHGAASSWKACWRHCGGKFIFKPIIWAFRFDNSPLVWFSLPSTEGQWMFVRISWCVLWYVIRDNCCSRGAPVVAVVVYSPMTSAVVGHRRSFAFRTHHDHSVTTAAACACVVNASR